eukprot:3120668-Alexandrium_andersonii.AAC.1
MCIRDSATSSGAGTGRVASGPRRPRRILGAARGVRASHRRPRPQGAPEPHWAASCTSSARSTASGAAARHREG